MIFENAARFLIFIVKSGDDIFLMIRWRMRDCPLMPRLAPAARDFHELRCAKVPRKARDSRNVLQHEYQFDIIFDYFVEDALIDEAMKSRTRMKCRAYIQYAHGHAFDGMRLLAFYYESTLLLTTAEYALYASLRAMPEILSIGIYIA